MLLQALVWRFYVHYVRNHPDATARNLGSLNVAQITERVERDYPLLQSPRNELGFAVAGEVFLLKNISSMVKQMEAIKAKIGTTTPLYSWGDLDGEKFQDATSNWEEFLERKKLLFREVLRSNVFAFFETQRKLFKQGSVGTKLAGKHREALSNQTRLIKQLIQIYNEEFVGDEELDWATVVVSGWDGFWSLKRDCRISSLVDMRSAEAEVEIIRREVYNLYQSIVTVVSFFCCPVGV